MVLAHGGVDRSDCSVLKPGDQPPMWLSYMIPKKEGGGAVQNPGMQGG